MTLNPVTLTFDTVGSLLGLSLIQIPSLAENGLGVLEILNFFQYDLDLRPHGVTSSARSNAYTKFG